MIIINILQVIVLLMLIAMLVYQIYTTRKQDKMIEEQHKAFMKNLESGCRYYEKQISQLEKQDKTKKVLD